MAEISQETAVIPSESNETGCGSSVVECALGKGEVGSSILPRSTIRRKTTTTGTLTEARVLAHLLGLGAQIVLPYGHAQSLNTAGAS